MTDTDEKQRKFAEGLKKAWGLTWDIDRRRLCGSFTVHQVFYPPFTSEHMLEQIDRVEKHFNLLCDEMRTEAKKLASE